MGDLLIRDVDEGLVRQLRRNAKIEGTSLQVEAKGALARGVTPATEELKAISAELDRARGDRPPTTVSGAEIVREVREESGTWSKTRA